MIRQSPSATRADEALPRIRASWSFEGDVGCDAAGTRRNWVGVNRMQALLSAEREVLLLLERPPSVLAVQGPTQ